MLGDAAEMAVELRELALGRLGMALGDTVVDAILIV